MVTIAQLTRGAIERDATIPHLAHRVIEWLSRQPHRVHTAKEIGDALGTSQHEIAEMLSCCRGTKGYTESRDGDRHLPLGEIKLTANARAAFATDEKKWNT